MIFLLCTLAAAVANPVLTAPSGMDLLYDGHVPLLPGGEPLVTLGIAMGEPAVVVRANTTLSVSFYEGNISRQVMLPAQSSVRVSIKRAQAANRNFYVDLEGVTNPSSQRVAQALMTWRRRGLGAAMALEEGTLLGMGGRIVDNRSVRIAVPAASATEAARLAATLGRRHRVRATVKEHLAERPWAELIVTHAGTPLGLATSYVRFTAEPGGGVEVADVEYGRGYAWHGRANRAYRGDVYAVVDPNGKLAAVNALGAETLLQGVVPAEIFASSPMEALKAQAVAARNTLLAKLGRRHFIEPFQLCGEQHCQVYGGADKEDSRTTEAVRATRGQVLFLQGKLVDAVYSANCGGHTEDNDAVWGDSPNPALRARPDFDTTDLRWQPFLHGLNDRNMEAFVRTQPASYCAMASHPRPDKFRWQKTLNALELQNLVARVYPEVGTVRDIEPLSRGHGGRLRGLRLVGSRRTQVVSRELAIRQLFGNLNSAAFTVQRRHDTRGVLQSVTFTGSGWGHGVGLCQLGAIGRAEVGQSFAAILRHYYNGAQIERVY